MRRFSPLPLSLAMQFRYTRAINLCPRLEHLAVFAAVARGQAGERERRVVYFSLSASLSLSLGKPMSRTHVVIYTCGLAVAESRLMPRAFALTLSGTGYIAVVYARGVFLPIRSLDYAEIPWLLSPRMWLLPGPGVAAAGMYVRGKRI